MMFKVIRYFFGKICPFKDSLNRKAVQSGTFKISQVLAISLIILHCGNYIGTTLNLFMDFGNMTIFTLQNGSRLTTIHLTEYYCQKYTKNYTSKQAIQLSSKMNYGTKEAVFRRNTKG